MGLDVVAPLEQMLRKATASRTSGFGFWARPDVGGLRQTKIMISDRPDGLRTQPPPGDHLAFGSSLPATVAPSQRLSHESGRARVVSWPADYSEEVELAPHDIGLGVDHLQGAAAAALAARYQLVAHRSNRLEGQGEWRA